MLFLFGITEDVIFDSSTFSDLFGVSICGTTRRVFPHH